MYRFMNRIYIIFIFPLYIQYYYQTHHHVRNTNTIPIINLIHYKRDHQPQLLASISSLLFYFIKLNYYNLVK